MSERERIGEIIANAMADGLSISPTSWSTELWDKGPLEERVKLTDFEERSFNLISVAEGRHLDTMERMFLCQRNIPVSSPMAVFQLRKVRGHYDIDQFLKRKGVANTDG